MVLNTEWSQVEVIDLINDGTGLGFGIVGGRSTGVVVKSILPGGRADRDNRLQSGDHILQIGDVHLRGLGSEQVAMVLRQQQQQQQQRNGENGGGTAGDGCGTGNSTSLRIVVARPLESVNYVVVSDATNRASDEGDGPKGTTTARSPLLIVPTKILQDPDELQRHLAQNGYVEFGPQEQCDAEAKCDELCEDADEYQPECKNPQQTDKPADDSEHSAEKCEILRETCEVQTGDCEKPTEYGEKLTELTDNCENSVSRSDKQDPCDQLSDSLDQSKSRDDTSNEILEKAPENNVQARIDRRREDGQTGCEADGCITQSNSQQCEGGRCDRSVDDFGRIDRRQSETINRNRLPDNQHSGNDSNNNNDDSFCCCRCYHTARHCDARCRQLKRQRLRDERKSRTVDANLYRLEDGTDDDDDDAGGGSCRDDRYHKRCPSSRSNPDRRRNHQRHRSEDLLITGDRFAIDEPDGERSDAETERYAVTLRKSDHGLGITVAGYVCEREDLSGIFVRDVTDDTEASRCGLIAANDRIVAVDGVELRAMSNREAVERLRRTGSTVRLTFERYVSGPRYERLKEARWTTAGDEGAASGREAVATDRRSGCGISTNLSWIPIDAEMDAEPNREPSSTAADDTDDALTNHRPASSSSTTSITATDEGSARRPQNQADESREIFVDADDFVCDPHDVDRTESCVKRKWETIIGAERNAASMRHERQCQQEEGERSEETAEMVEIESEPAEEEIVVAHLTKLRGLGISLEGTVDVEGGLELRPRHFIRSILPEGPVGRSGQLNTGDELLEANGQRLRGKRHVEVVRILRELPRCVRLVCARKRDDANRVINTSQDREAFEQRNIVGGSLKNLLQEQQQQQQEKVHRHRQQKDVDRDDEEDFSEEVLGELGDVDEEPSSSRSSALSFEIDRLTATAEEVDQRLAEDQIDYEERRRELSDHAEQLARIETREPEQEHEQNKLSNVEDSKDQREILRDDHEEVFKETNQGEELDDRKLLKSEPRESENQQEHCERDYEDQEQDITADAIDDDDEDDDEVVTVLSDRLRRPSVCKPLKKSLSDTTVDGNRSRKAHFSAKPMASDEETREQTEDSTKSVSLTQLTMWSDEIEFVELIKTDRGLGFSILDYQHPIDSRSTVIVVRTIVPNGPAECDGRLKPGDRLVSVDGKPLRNLALDRAVLLLKSTAVGCRIKLGVMRPINNEGNAKIP